MARVIYTHHQKLWTTKFCNKIWVTEGKKLSESNPFVYSESWFLIFHFQLQEPKLALNLTYGCSCSWISFCASLSHFLLFQQAAQAGKIHFLSERYLKFSLFRNSTLNSAMGSSWNCVWYPLKWKIWAWFKYFSCLGLLDFLLFWSRTWWKLFHLFVVFCWIEFSFLFWLAWTEVRIWYQQMICCLLAMDNRLRDHFLMQLVKFGCDCRCAFTLWAKGPSLNCVLHWIWRKWRRPTSSETFCFRKNE